MVSALLFDFGGTLDGPLHWLDRFHAQYRAAGIEISRAELDRAFDHATRSGYRAGKVIQRFGLLDLIRFLVGSQLEFLADEGPTEIRERFSSMEPGEKHRTVERLTAGFVKATREGLHGSQRVLQALKARFRIGVVSNFYGNLDRIVEEAGMKKLIDSLVDSSRVGIFKPAPEIFQAALHALRVNPAEAAMIGDSLGKDCAPALRLGLRTVWYRSTAYREARPDRSIAEFTITSLDEVASLQW